MQDKLGWKSILSFKTSPFLVFSPNVMYEYIIRFMHLFMHPNVYGRTLPVGSYMLACPSVSVFRVSEKQMISWLLKVVINHWNGICVTHSLYMFY